jgi:hypothetical protein
VLFIFGSLFPPLGEFFFSSGIILQLLWIETGTIRVAVVVLCVIILAYSLDYGGGYA